MALFKLLTSVVPKACVYQRCCYKSSVSHVKVTLCGAAGQIGQPLGLLLKQSPYIDELALYDCQETSGLAMELGQVDTKCAVESYCPSTECSAFENANVVVVVSGLHAVGNKALESVFPKNAVMIQQTINKVIKYCPKALIAIGTNPIEGLVPVASEKLKLAGIYNPGHVFGITTLNVIRANTFSANMLGLQPECVTVPVIGGNCDCTIIPLLTQALPSSEFTDVEIEDITHQLQTAQYDVEKFHTSEGPQLANAFAVARFVVSLVKGLRDYKEVVEYAFVRTNDVATIKYFGVPILLGPDGVEKDLALPTLSAHEQCMIDTAVPIIKYWIEKGNQFVGKIDTTVCDHRSSAQTDECPDPCEKEKAN